MIKVAKIAKVEREDGSEWRFTYDSRGQLSSALRFTGVLKTADYAYVSDSITNILSGGKKKSDGSAEFAITPDIFNAINLRQVGSQLEVSGSAIEEATVSVNDIKTQRLGMAFFASLNAGNNDSAVMVDLNVTGVLFDSSETPEIGGDQPGNQPGSDVVATVSSSVFMPKAIEDFQYDMAGRITSDSLRTYSWDANNWLISVESKIPLYNGKFVKVENFYDYAGRRIKKSVFNKSSPTDSWLLTSDSFFYYDQVLLNGSPADFGVLTAEKILDGSGNMIGNYFYLCGLDMDGSYQGLGGIGSLAVAEDKLNGKTYLPCMDSKGTVYSWIDADTGETVAKLAYDPYGKIILKTGDINLPFTFNGKYTDFETGLVYYGLRWYDPLTCKWLSRDPIGEHNNEFNLYAMTNNDPINNIDILGCVWYNPLDRDFCLYTAGYNTGLHLYEAGYSPVRAGMRMYDTGASWNLVNPGKGRFFAYETLDAARDAVSVVGGYPISIGSGDIFDRQDSASFDPLHPTVVNNGMLNSDQNAKDMQIAVQEKLGITGSGLVKNSSHFFGIGDAIQILGNEFWLTDITAIRTAQMIRKADSLGTQYIDTINHSQGVTSFQMGTNLLDSPAILNKIRNQSFGGEAYNDAGSLGIASSRNLWNAKDKNALSMNKDWVPTFGMGNPLNAIQTIRKFTGSEWIDTVVREGNNHGFIPFYSDFIINYNK